MNDLQDKQVSRFQKRLHAFGHATRGLKTLFATQCHFRFHALMAVAVVALGFSLRLSSVEWCCIVFAIAGVLVCEAFNTAIEFLTDRISTDHHPLSGKAKDVAAAAVLLSAIGAAIVGAIILGPKLWVLLY